MIGGNISTKPAAPRNSRAASASWFWIRSTLRVTGEVRCSRGVGGSSRTVSRLCPCVIVISFLDLAHRPCENCLVELVPDEGQRVHEAGRRHPGWSGQLDDAPDRQRADPLPLQAAGRVEVAAGASGGVWVQAVRHVKIADRK